MSSQKVSGEQQEPSILSGIEAGFEFYRRNFDNPALEWRRLFSEVLGTFLLVLVGAGGGVVNAVSNGQISRAAAVTAPGLMVLAIILFMGAISGAHLNPAVSIAFATRGNFPWLRVPGYIIAQLVGSALAVLLLRATFGNVGMLGATEPGPGISDWQTVLVEFVVTAGLVSGSLFWLFSLSSVLVTGWSDSIGTKRVLALLGGIGMLWVILWLLVGRERPETRRMPVLETQGEHSRTHWSEVLPLLFSRTVLFSILAAFGAYWATVLYLSWNPVYLVTVRHLKLNDPLYLAGITLPYLVGAIAFIAFGAFADRIFRRTGSSRRSHVYTVSVLLIVSALCLFLAVSVPSALGSIIFFTLAFFGVAIPMISTIISVMAPKAHRGAVLGIVVAIFTLPGIIAPLVTGLIIQAAGKNVTVGFHNAYLLASLLLLVFGAAFLACARPDDQHLGEKGSIHVVLSHE